MVYSLMLKRLTFALLVSSFVWCTSASFALGDYYDGLREFDLRAFGKAFEFWKEAANAGDERSQLALGKLYEDGLGTPQNYVSAYLYFSLAAMSGAPDALEARDRVTSKMTKEQVAQGQERAATWLPLKESSRSQESVPSAGDSAPEPSMDQTAHASVSTVREAQHLLNALGYGAGTEDGILGAQTRRAIARFQTEAGLTPSGGVTNDLLLALRARLSAAPPPRQSKEPRQAVRMTGDLCKDVSMLLDQTLRKFPDIAVVEKQSTYTSTTLRKEFKISKDSGIIINKERQPENRYYANWRWRGINVDKIVQTYRSMINEIQDCSNIANQSTEDSAEYSYTFEGENSWAAWRSWENNDPAVANWMVYFRAGTSIDPEEEADCLQEEDPDFKEFACKWAYSGKIELEIVKGSMAPGYFTRDAEYLKE